MTDSTPDPELDELVTAHLDGEATADERARVQSDPVLLARAEQLRAVSRMIAEPVVAPDAVQREAHIAAALEASSTSPVVTAMPTGRSRPDLLRFASVAAVVLAILVAVPLLLSNTGSDDDMATSDATSADDGPDAMDAVAAEGSDGAAEMAAEEEPADRSSGGFGDEGADDGAMHDGAEMAQAESDDADASLADEAAAEEEAATDAELGPADVDATLAGVPRIDIDRAASPGALRRQVERQLAAGLDSNGGGEATTATDLTCGPAIAQEIALNGPAAAVGTAVVDGDVTEYLIISEPVSVIIIFDAATCAALFLG